MAVRSGAAYFPILDWGRTYDRGKLANDFLAAIIVTIMLIPQSLAYAMLAGLPAEAGLYASILPILLYTVMGSSRVLAVGPVAVVSLMTAATIGHVAEAGTAGYAVAALTLAFLSGSMLLVMGLLRLGFIANFLSHPVISGFISASGILIASSQIAPLTGLKAEGHTLFLQLSSLGLHIHQTNLPTLAIGIASLGFLFWVRRGMKPLLRKLGLAARSADMITKAGPVLTVVVSTLTVWWFTLDQAGVAVVGAVPQSLPPFTLPSFDFTLVKSLLIPAALISMIGFVESVSVGQTLAAKRRQRISPDQELVALGAANLGASLSGGFPVTGGFARSVVNYDAGAETPAAGAFTAIGLALAALFLTPFIAYLPKATLAATIVVAVLSLVDLSILKRSWLYSRADFTAVATTMAVTLLVSVEAGVMAGVLISLALHLYHTSRPHIAEVGLLSGTEHFRNINRFKVQTNPNVLSLRIDESLYFANSQYLEDFILARVSGNKDIRHIILMCSAVNEIDLSALETLEALNHRLQDKGVTLNLSEVKGPVMDRLRKTDFITQLSGQIFVSQFEGWSQLIGAEHMTEI